MKSVPALLPGLDRHASRSPKKGGTLTQVLADDAATLVYLAGQNVVTPHIWLSRADEPRQPDRLILDFDPSPGGGFADVRAAARDAGDAAARRRAGDVRDGHRLARHPRGLPAAPRAVASATSTRSPARSPRRWSPTTRDHLTLEWRKADRGARIYVDVNRINYAQHAVAPYGVRPAPRRARWPCRSHWDELSDARLAPDRWTIATAADRLAARATRGRASPGARGAPKLCRRTDRAVPAGGRVSSEPPMPGLFCRRSLRSRRRRPGTVDLHGGADTAQPPAILAGDAEREHSTQLLSRAVVEGRLTLEEFSDRVGARPGGTHARRAGHADAGPAGRTAASPRAREGTSTDLAQAHERHVAFCSRLVRSGPWELAARSEFRSFFGTITLDLSQARLAGSEVELQIYNLFGTVTIIVPRASR